VQVWFLPTRQKASADLLCLLQDQEKSEHARFSREGDRQAFAHTRAALRCLLSRAIGVSAKEIRFDRNAWGKPQLSNEHGRCDIDFSVSHSGELAVIAISRCGATGVDIERKRAVPEMETIASEVFGEAVTRRLSRVPPQHRDIAFLRLWTAGEAYIKALGVGLAGAAGHVPVALEADGEPRLQRAENAAERWALLPLDLPADYLGSLVVRGSVPAKSLPHVPEKIDIANLVSCIH